MPYTIYRGDEPNNNHKMAEVESFFIYFKLGFTKSLAKVQVHSGCWAICCSGSTDEYPQGRPERNNEPQTYYMKTPNGSGMRFNRSRLQYSRKIEYGNEFTDLHLFEFTGDPNQLAAAPAPGAGGPAGPQFVPWVDLTDMGGAVNSEPTAARNQKPLLLRRLSLNGLFERRYVYAMSVGEDGQGTSELAAAMPFDNPTCLASLISLNGATMANLNVWTGIRSTPLAEPTVRNALWTYFAPEQVAPGAKLPGTPTGFVMVAQGAFKGIRWEEIDKWNGKALKGPTLLRELRKVVANYRLASSGAGDYDQDPYLRTLESVDDTKGDGITPRSPDDPIEVLYLDGLNDADTNVQVPQIL